MKIWIRALSLLLALMLLGGCGAPAAQETEPTVTQPTAEETVPETTGETLPPIPEDDYAEQNKLSNPYANVTTQKVYDYICSLSGVNVLAGQQESTWMGSPDYEMNYIYENTEKYPAIRGLDYMHDDFSGVNQRAIQWWNEGGLVTIMWHTGCDFSGEWADALADEISDWDAVLTPGTAAYDNFIAGMDKAAEALLELQEAGVTVIWRPFHEFDGRWFWWGKGDREDFIKLWQTMYDRYTYHWGLNNLIWVLPYSGNGYAYDKWYPGDSYCDILGADSYDGGVQNGLYQKLTTISSAGKPYCFHECGTNPTAEELKTTPWTWFMTWHTDHITGQNDPEALSLLYNSDYVITKDELPSFTD